jgi:RNA polymerase sigma-70 factor (ECF subfamily)
LIPLQRRRDRSRVVAESNGGNVTTTAATSPLEHLDALSPPATFDEVYAAHFGDLTVQLYAYFGDRQEAQDVVQEAFCRALAKWHTVSKYEDPVAWVRRVAWNLAVSKWRRARTALNFLRKQHPDDTRVAGPSPERVALVAALGTLPPTQRRAMVLRYLADLTVAEIAERERVPEGTVKSWLGRGRAALAIQLRPADSDQEVRRA